MLIMIILTLFLNNRKIEKFENKKEIEILDDSEIVFKVDKLINKDTVSFRIGNFRFSLNYKNPREGFTIYEKNKLIKKIDLDLKMDKKYIFNILVYPVNNILLVLLNDILLALVKSNSNLSRNQEIQLDKEITYEQKKSQLKYVHDLEGIYRLCSNNNVLNVNTSNKLELLEKIKINETKGTLWYIKKHKNYYTIKNIVNSLTLCEKNKQINLDTKDCKHYIFNKNKEYYLINEEGFVMNLNKLEFNKVLHKLELEKVDNIGNWLTYNSSILLKNKNLYLSGNMNLFYSKTNTPIVYMEDVDKKGLTEWTIEDYFGIKNGRYIIEKDEIYLKNNGKYLQVLRGNYSPSRSGLEVSLGEKKNENSKWIIRKTKELGEFFRKGENIYLYNPKMDVYLNSGSKMFKVLNMEKKEVYGSSTIDNNWIIEGKVINKEKHIFHKVDYERYSKDKQYFNKRENKWRRLLKRENDKIRRNLNKFKVLKENEKEIDDKINLVKSNIERLKKEKCPPRKLCLNPIDYNCITKKKKQQNKNNKLYDIVYVNENKERLDKNRINSNNIEKCKTIRDYNIEESEYVRNKKYVKKKDVKTKITDFKINEFPEYNQLVSIESIPEDKKITDFKISELMGYDKLKLKSEYKK